MPGMKILLFFMLIGSIICAQPRFGGGLRPLKRNGEPLQVAVVQEGASKRNPLELWSAYYVYRQNNTQYLLGLPDERSRTMVMGERLGWIKKDCLLDSSHALRTQRKIYRKVIVFDNKREKRVPIYSSPHSSATSISKAPMFSFFYIYKETPDYYLLGTSANIDIEYCDESLLGWIHKKSCREWNTRLAINYSTSTRQVRLEKEKEGEKGLVRIYKTLADAIAQNNKQVIATETPQTIWTYNMPRYALLRSASEKQKRLFNIAFLGGTQGHEIQHVIAQIQGKRGALRKLDIMFVVDASAEPQIRQKLSQAIRSLQRDLRKRSHKRKVKSLDIAWAITYYHDFTKGRRYRYRRGRLFEGKVVNINPFTTDIAQFHRNINNEPFRSNPDQRKSLFYGIDMALHRKAKWRENSTRCMLIFGGAGNHARGSSQDISKLRLADIQEALKKKRIRVYSFQTMKAKSKENQKNFDAFAKQMAQLVKNMGEGAHFSNKRTLVELHSLLPMIVKQYEQEVHLLYGVLVDLERGFPLDEAITRYQKYWHRSWGKTRRTAINNIDPLGAPQRILGSGEQDILVIEPSMTSVLLNFLRSQNIAYKKLQGYGSYFDKGWVWEYQPQSNLQQIQVYLLMDRMELSRLIGFLSSLLNELKKASRPEQYIEIWKTLLKASFGIDTIPANEPLDNMVMQRTGLPFINGLLNYTLDDFVKNSRRPEFRRKLIEKLDKTCGKLSLVLEEKEQGTVKIIEGEVMEKKKKRWWQDEGSEMNYAWIEIELFP